ncbi:serine hydrolase [Nereida sp. MMG025]|uniref:serine hydrolase domain-containing protein n=1 Tax=Nereida sp. MMG025 TaxID=2909981 RepID=UPI001F177907|nr:serine hydrolase domain-containing protein [Nereida sp. MMG025]MCF6445096.1 beta-lactamase family protein [Nereida sp. MMG025]
MILKFRFPRRAFAAVALFALLSACAPQPQSVPTQSLEADLTAWMARSGIKQATLGMVKDGRTLRQIDKGRSATRAYPTASLSKAVTAMCLNSTLANSPFSWNSTLGSMSAPLARRNLSPTPNTKALTLADFATHQTGLKTKMDQGNGSVVSLDQFTQKRLAKAALERADNQTKRRGFVYSNANYAVLGEVIEGIANKPYANHCGATILRPAGVTGASVSGTFAATQSFGGWSMSVIDYAKFASHWFGPNRPWVKNPNAYPFEKRTGYGLGVFSGVGPQAGWISHGGEWNHPDPALRHGSVFVVAPSGAAVAVTWQGNVPVRTVLDLIQVLQAHLR